MINRVLKGVLGLFLLTAVISCNKDDESIFDKTATERLSAQEAELREALDSSEYGWKLVYFTDDTSLGGFTFLFDFIDENNVRMVSDFNDETLTPLTSEFEIQLRSTTSLVFVTNNHIHKLSDPIDSPVETAKGYKGDFQFRYYGKTEDEIVFRTTKTFKEIRFVKATAEDWNLISKNREIAEKIFNQNKPLFRSIEINNGGNVSEYDLLYNSAARFFTMQDKSQTLLSDGGFGVGFTDNGVIVSPALDIDGELISNFVYESSSMSFVSTDSDNVVVRIKYIPEPIEWTNDYKKLLPGVVSGSKVFFVQTDQSIYRSPSTTQLVRDAIENIGKDNAGNLNLSQAAYIFEGSNNYIVYVVNGQQYACFFNVTDGGKYLKLTQTGWNVNVSNVPQEVIELNKLLVDPKGIFVKVEDFNIEYSNKVVTFISGSTASALSVWQETTATPF